MKINKEEELLTTGKKINKINCRWWWNSSKQIFNIYWIFGKTMVTSMKWILNRVNMYGCGTQLHLVHRRRFYVSQKKKLIIWQWLYSVEVLHDSMTVSACMHNTKSIKLNQLNGIQPTITALIILASLCNMSKCLLGEKGLQLSTGGN